MMKLFLLLFCLLLSAWHLPAADAQTQNFRSGTTGSDDVFQPWDAWRRGCLAYEDGEAAREDGDFIRALSTYREAIRCFRSVRKARPEWNRRVIDERISLCEKAIAETRRLLGRTSDDPDPAPAVPAAPADPATPVAASPELLKSEMEEYKRRFFAAQAELEQLKRGDARAKASLEQLANLMRDYRVLEEKNQILEARIAKLETQPAEAAPAETGQRLVELRINLENIRRKLKLATSEADEYKQENERLLTLNNDLTKEAVRLRSESAKLQQEAAQLRPIRERADRERNQFLLREEEWKKQLEAVRRTTDDRDRELAELNEKIKALSAGIPLDQTAENLKLREDLRHLQETCDSLSAENIRFRNESREHRLNAAELSNAVQSLNDRVSFFDRENRMMREQLEKRSSAAAIADRELVTLRTANREMEEQIARAAEREKEFEARFAAGLRADRAAAAGFREERDDLSRQLNAVKLEKTALAAAQQDLQQKLDGSESRYQELRAEFLKLKAASLSAAESEKKVPRLEEEKKALAAELASFRQQTAALQLALKEEKQRSAAIETLRQQLEQARKQAETAQTLRQQLTRLEAENQQLRDRPPAPPSPAGTVAAAPAPAPARPADPADVQKFRAAAAKAEAEQARELAIWNYRQILKSLPHDPDANYRLGKQLAARGEDKAALPLLQTAHLADPADPVRRVAYAAALTRTGKPGNAAALLADTGLPADDFDTALELGRALRLTDRSAEAESHLRRAAALQPRHPDAQLELARLFADNRPKDAAHHYENAKKFGATPVPELEKKLGDLVNQRAELADFLASAAAEAEKSGDSAAACWYYTELIQADPDEPAHRWKAIQHLLLLQRMEEADLMLGKAASPADTLLRGAFLILQNQSAEAEKCLASLTAPVKLPFLPALDRKLGTSPAAEKLRALLTR